MTATTKQKDFTTGSEWRQILVFSIPIILGNLLQQLYNTIDGVIVGRMVDSNALAAIGNCSTVISLFLAVAIGFGAGCGILISHYYGRRAQQDLRKTFTTGLLMVLILGLAMSVLGIALNGWIYRSVMAIRDEVILKYATEYFGVYCLGLVFTYAYNYISYVLRGVGDSRATLYFLAVTSVLNLILDLFMVRSMGIVGAAWATVISQVVCFLFSTCYMVRRYEDFAIRRDILQPDLSIAQKCVQMGVPTIMQQCSVSLGQGVMQRLVNHFGASVMAAYTVGAKLERYTTLPVLSMQISVSTFTGQNMGAGKPERVRRGMRQSMAMVLIIVALIGIPVNLAAPQLAALFGLTGEVSAMAAEYVRFSVPACMLIFGIYQILAGVLQGSGDVSYTTFISLSSLAIRALYAYVMTFFFGADYPILWRSIVIAYGWSLIFALVRYMSGKWKQKSEKISGNTDKKTGERPGDDVN